MSDRKPTSAEKWGAMPRWSRKLLVFAVAALLYVDLLMLDSVIQVGQVTSIFDDVDRLLDAIGLAVVGHYVWRYHPIILLSLAYIAIITAGSGGAAARRIGLRIWLCNAWVFPVVLIVGFYLGAFAREWVGVIIFGALWYVPYGLARLIFRNLPVAKLSPSSCPSCGYDLTKNESGICPECGVAVPSAVRSRVSVGGNRNAPP